MALPGYLIVSPTVPATAICGMPIDYQEQLGSNLALATRLTQEAISPIKLYCAQFGEEGHYLHYHVFPRTLEITTEFLYDFPEQKDAIHGPMLFDWARDRYKDNKESVWSIVSPVVIDMRKRITSNFS